MASNPTIPPIPPTAFVTTEGRLTREAYRFLFQINQKTQDAAQGSVTTGPSSGLQGGGSVADGISISIATNGVTNSMFRQSAGFSVVGRFAASPGNVSDIVAVSDPSVLMRRDNLLAFYPSLDNIEIGRTAPSPLVRTDELDLIQTPTAETIVPDHTIIISINGVDYKVPCVAA